MTLLVRTNYPRFKDKFTAQELERFYTPTTAELELAHTNALGVKPVLSFLLLLKTFQRLGYFPNLKEVPPQIKNHVFNCLVAARPDSKETETTTTQHKTASIETALAQHRPSPKALYRYHQVIRTYLVVQPYDEAAELLAANLTEELAALRLNSADLLNAVVEKLVEARYELPAFSTLDKLVEQIRYRVTQTLFELTANRIWTPQRKKLDGLVTPKAKPNPEQATSSWQKLRAIPKNPSLTHLQELQERYEWLLEFGDLEHVLSPLTHAIRKEFAAQARSLRAAELADYPPAKRYTLLACLVYRERITARDTLVETFLKRMAFFHTRAKETLVALREQKLTQTGQLLDLLAQVVRQSLNSNDPGVLGQSVATLIEKRGGTLTLLEQCEELVAYHQNNYLPFLWKFYRSHRAAIFKLVASLDFIPTGENETLLLALKYLLAHQNETALYLPLPDVAELDLTFASNDWLKLIVTHEQEKLVISRRNLEVAIFSYLATDLKTGDLAVSDAEQYADYRNQLLSWEECKPLLADFCAKTGLPSSGKELVTRLKTGLQATARQVDLAFTTNAQVEIDPKRGQPVLKKVPAKPRSRTLNALEAALHQELPSHTLLDILTSVQHHTNWTRHFGPLSGNEPRLDNPLERYLLTTFSFGTNLGPTQTARHLAASHRLTPQQIAFVNQRHIDENRLEAARLDIIASYAQFELPRLWGDGTRAGADGTQIELRRDNPTSEYHVRYGGYGGIGYHHVSDTYIALFTRFITCGTWEGVYILDLFNRSQINSSVLTETSQKLVVGSKTPRTESEHEQATSTALEAEAGLGFEPEVNPNAALLSPTKLHADTQGQSTPIFGLAYLLGIELMPRIRGWQDLVFYRTEPGEKYEHLAALFKNAETINWDLLENRYQELIRVAISMYKGRLLPSTLLRKLSSYSRKNKLYQAMRELGRAVRTEYLLRYISDADLRQIVTATTNKVESFHNFSNWLSFGGGGEGVLVENDPVEQQKRMQYLDLIANSVIYHNVIDMSVALSKLSKRGVKIYQEDVAALSPYLTRHIRRFGEYQLDLTKIPEPFDGRLAVDLLRATPQAASSDQPAVSSS